TEGSSGKNHRGAVFVYRSSVTEGAGRNGYPAETTEGTVMQKQLNQAPILVGPTANALQDVDELCSADQGQQCALDPILREYADIRRFLGQLSGPSYTPTLFFNYTFSTSSD